jgi:hypothetical protein
MGRYNERFDCEGHPRINLKPAQAIINCNLWPNIDARVVDRSSAAGVKGGTWRVRGLCSILLFLVGDMLRGSCSRSHHIMAVIRKFIFVPELDCKSRRTLALDFRIR